MPLQAGSSSKASSSSWTSYFWSASSKVSLIASAPSLIASRRSVTSSSNCASSSIARPAAWSAASANVSRAWVNPLRNVPATALPSSTSGVPAFLSRRSSVLVASVTSSRYPTSASLRSARSVADMSGSSCAPARLSAQSSREVHTDFTHFSAETSLAAASVGKPTATSPQSISAAAAARALRDVAALIRLRALGPSGAGVVGEDAGAVVLVLQGGLELGVGAGACLLHVLADRVEALAELVVDLGEGVLEGVAGREISGVLHRPLQQLLGVLEGGEELPARGSAAVHVRDSRLLQGLHQSSGGVDRVVQHGGRLLARLRLGEGAAGGVELLAPLAQGRAHRLRPFLGRGLGREPRAQERDAPGQDADRQKTVTISEHAFSSSNACRRSWFVTSLNGS